MIPWLLLWITMSTISDLHVSIFYVIVFDWPSFHHFSVTLSKVRKNEKKSRPYPVLNNDHYPRIVYWQITPLILKGKGLLKTKWYNATISQLVPLCFREGSMRYLGSNFHKCSKMHTERWIQSLRLFPLRMKFFRVKFCVSYKTTTAASKMKVFRACSRRSEILRSKLYSCTASQNYEFRSSYKE